MVPTVRDHYFKVMHCLGDYLHDHNRGAGTLRFTDSLEHKTSRRGALQMLTRELNLDRSSPSYVTDKAISHRRPNKEDIVHVVKERWEGTDYSTVYIVSDRK